MAQDYWLFQRRGTTRWTFAWAPDPAKRSKRKQALLPEEIKVEREAKRYAELHEEELKCAKTRARAHGASVADLVERWIALRADDARFSAATVRDATSQLRRWVCRPIGSAPNVIDIGSRAPEHVEVPLLRKWVRTLGSTTGRKGKPLAPYTIRNVLRSLRWFFSDIIGEGWVTLVANPAAADAVQSELPTMQPIAGKSQKLRLTLEQGQVLVDCSRVRLQWRVRYILGMVTGLRDGELSGLRTRDVNLGAAPSIRVRQALQLKSRAGYAKLGKTKTRESARLVPLHAAGGEALREWLGEAWEVHVGRKPNADDFVFVRSNGQAWRPRSAVRLRGHLRRAGLPDQVDGFPLTFHALRRSFVSWLRAEKVPQEARAVLMGHAPRTAEERHYSDEDSGVLAEYVSRIRIVWRRVQEASVRRVEEQMAHEKPLHVRPTVRRLRKDSEG